MFIAGRKSIYSYEPDFLTVMKFLYTFCYDMRIFLSFGPKNMFVHENVSSIVTITHTGNFKTLMGYLLADFKVFSSFHISYSADLTLQRTF